LPSAAARRMRVVASARSEDPKRRPLAELALLDPLLWAQLHATCSVGGGASSPKLIAVSGLAYGQAYPMDEVSRVRALVSTLRLEDGAVGLLVVFYFSDSGRSAGFPCDGHASSSTSTIRAGDCAPPQPARALPLPRLAWRLPSWRPRVQPRPQIGSLRSEAQPLAEPLMRGEPIPRAVADAFQALTERVRSAFG